MTMTSLGAPLHPRVPVRNTRPAGSAASVGSNRYLPVRRYQLQGPNGRPRERHAAATPQRRAGARIEGQHRSAIGPGGQARRREVEHPVRRSPRTRDHRPAGCRYAAARSRDRATAVSRWPARPRHRQLAARIERDRGPTRGEVTPRDERVNAEAVRAGAAHGGAHAERGMAPGCGPRRIQATATSPRALTAAAGHIASTDCGTGIARRVPGRGGRRRQRQHGECHGRERSAARSFPTHHEHASTARGGPRAR